MKWFSILFCFFVFIVDLSAQKNSSPKPLKEFEFTATSDPKTSKNKIGDVIWSEDFNREKWESTVVQKGSYWDIISDSSGYIFDTTAQLPEGWKFIDSTYHNYFWHWSDVGPRGFYTRGSDNDFLTPDNDLLQLIPKRNTLTNGFMLLESDYFHSNPSIGCVADPVYSVNSYVEYGPIDMSIYNGAIFNCKILCRLCCQATKSVNLLISTNYNPNSGSGNWQAYKLSNPPSLNEHQHDYTSHDIHIDISKQIVGQDSVYFRIMNQDASHYFVIIDDIVFYEPPKCNLVLNDGWVDYLYYSNDSLHKLPFTFFDTKHKFNGGYTQIPKKVSGNFVKFRAAAYNFATDTAFNSKLNLTIYKNKVLVLDTCSLAKNLASHAADTFTIETRFKPDETGTYQILLNLVQDSIDEIPDDNSWKYTFEVTENYYSRVTKNGEAFFKSVSPANWFNGGIDGDVCAQPYNFPESLVPISLKAARVYYTKPPTLKDQESIENGDFAMYARVYVMDENGTIVDAGIASDLYTITMNDTNTWVNLEFLNQGNLTISNNQTIYVGIETYTKRANTERLNFTIGADNYSPKQPLDGGIIWLSSQNEWYLTGNNYAIDLILADEQPKVNVTFNLVNVNCLSVNGVFNPETDTLFVYGDFNNWIIPGAEGSLMLINTGDNVVYSATIQLEANTGIIQYKYFKNSGLEGGEWEGEPYRKATINSTDVIISDIVPPCNSIIQNTSEAITLHPNPFTHFVKITSLASGSKLIVRDIIGKTVKTTTTKESELLWQLNDLKNGVYFLTIYNTNGTLTTLKIIKNK